MDQFTGFGSVELLFRIAVLPATFSAPERYLVPQFFGLPPVRARKGGFSKGSIVSANEG
jgi:hypothetical protein